MKFGIRQGVVQILLWQGKELKRGLLEEYSNAWASDGNAASFSFGRL